MLCLVNMVSCFAWIACALNELLLLSVRSHRAVGLLWVVLVLVLGVVAVVLRRRQ